MGNFVPRFNRLYRKVAKNWISREMSKLGVNLITDSYSFRPFNFSKKVSSHTLKVCNKLEHNY
jgi:hypothetical protein